MRPISRILPLLILAFFVGCGEQLVEPDSSATQDSPLLKRGGKPGGGGSGGGTPADPAIAYVEGSNLKVMNEDGSNQTIIVANRLTSYRNTSWSPVGTSLAYVANESLMRVDLALDNGIPVATGFTALGPRHTGDPAWSPAGDIIAYPGGCGADEPDGTCGDGFTQYLMTVPAVGGEPTIVYEVPMPASNDWNRTVSSHPTWNPDGTQIAFVTSRDETGNPLTIEALRILTLADAPTQNARALIDEGVFYNLHSPEWSRDGSLIAFGGRKTSSSDYAVYVVDVATGDWHQLGLRGCCGFNGAPYSWSPDDSKLVVDLDRAVRLVDADPASTTYGQVIPKRKSKLASGGHPNWRRCVTGATGCGLH